MPGAVEMGKDAVPYGEPTYWDERYQTSREKLGPDKYYFDWYCTFEDIWPTLQTYCGKEMVEAMGGADSSLYVKFRLLCCEAFNILRRPSASNLILNLLLVRACCSARQRICRI